MIRYLDTSAALKLLVDEPHSDALAADLERSLQDGDHLVASWLLYTELHCAAQRRRGILVDAVNGVLDAVGLIDLKREDLHRAATSAWGLRSADAIHLATALRIHADQLVSYDDELTATAADAGLPTASPGR
ncbi:type II toxin-antitoxin system VapC family toxin [Georgenia sp. TF02-10]|uniref:type II toxin-antitoxin system VapC family toxin n=1 Tax=Georgenia sp. TF02-10 TaxID=2917725 RepID=UPI001FA6E02E|nr:type II toxin-antitoxin system VapC family toxin [Georgenia sp. TF02-10]UNX55365.1 type II toxin-antitoxin system VapC family toxin [Georgenia sp. TF02-10]